MLDRGSRDPLRAPQLAERVLLPIVAAALLAGGAALLVGHLDVAAWLWGGGTVIVLAFLSIQIATSLAKGEFGLDVIAAFAMAGTLALGEHLAGIIIALMFTGGEALEGFAQTRARRELSALLNRVPRSAARYTDSKLEEVELDILRPGDRILVRGGEVVPVDGMVSSGVAVLDESALTGEALPVRRRPGETVMSGSTNADSPFDLTVTNTARDSTYSGIIRLVEAAQAAKAPMARLADRFALIFLFVTIAVAGGAWLISDDPVRALAVFVVATPCPLILAVPVAIIAGVSRCAKKGVLVKGGGALEMLARTRTVLLDKTGTLTDGRARLIEMKCRSDMESETVLRLAASLDQGSHHVIAHALVAAARERGLRLETAAGSREIPGSGLSGRVADRDLVVGGWSFVSSRTESSTFSKDVENWIRRDGTVAVLVGIDGHLAGAFLFADEVRPEAGTVLRQLRDAGIARLVLVTGDRADLAQGVASLLGMDRVVAETKPQDKTLVVEAEKLNGPVMMVGDGVNDAPALAAADVGVAMGARGAAASSEAADVVILMDRLDRVVSAIRIARRSRAIALQSVYVGMGLSFTAMIVAAFGYLTPVQGALLQEAIDVLVILNALRALAAPLRQRQQTGLPLKDLLALEAEHQSLMDVLDEIRNTAERTRDLPNKEVRLQLETLDDMLRQRLLPHEKRDDAEIYARIRRQAGSSAALAGMSRTHMEIQRRVQDLTSLRKALGADGPNPSQRYEIQRLLHGLEAVTRLHFAQEDQIYRALESG